MKFWIWWLVPVPFKDSKIRRTFRRLSDAMKIARKRMPDIVTYDTWWPVELLPGLTHGLWEFYWDSECLPLLVEGKLVAVILKRQVPQG